MIIDKLHQIGDIVIVANNYKIGRVQKLHRIDVVNFTAVSCAIEIYRM